MTLSPEEDEAMAHAVGMDIELGEPYRHNHFFATAEQKPMWESLCARGLAKFAADPAEGHFFTVYMLTPEGLAALKAQMQDVAA